jgi:hypothetical protein
MSGRSARLTVRLAGEDATEPSGAVGRLVYDVPSGGGEDRAMHGLSSRIIPSTACFPSETIALTCAMATRTLSASVLSLRASVCMIAVKE